MNLVHLWCTGVITGVINRGNYLELLELICQYDSILDNLFKKSTVFRGMSSTIQNDIIASLSSLTTEKLKEEIDKDNFIAFILNETSDILNKSRLSTVIRFIDHNGNARERFLHFTDVSNNQCTATLLEHIKNILNSFDVGKKLVAQAYGSVTIMAGQNNGLN